MARRVVFPWLLVVLLKFMLPTWVLVESLSAALVLILKVMVFADVVTVPDADEAVSHGGTLVTE